MFIYYNGTTFIGAAKQLKQDILNCDEVESASVEIGTTWHFIPTISLYFGGLW